MQQLYRLNEVRAWWPPAVATFVLVCGLAFAVNAEQVPASPNSEGADTRAQGEPSGETATAAASSDSGPTPEPLTIVRVFGFPITNSMVVTWIVALGLIVSAQVATRKMDLVPTGLQNFWEWLVEGLQKFLEQIIGRHLVTQTFWFFATVFIFILAANWAGLLPGIGTIGWGQQTAEGFKIETPLLRGATSDLNLTLAMALVFFGLWLYWVLREVGPVGLVRELFTAPKGDMSRLLRLLLAPIFLASGCIEIISILVRPVALCFRLYGNIFAGDTMLETIATLVPGLAWLLPIPVYFMELLFGLVQALVFMLLCAVFTLLECPQEEEAATAVKE